MKHTKGFIAWMLQEKLTDRWLSIFCETRKGAREYKSAMFCPENYVVVKVYIRRAK